MRPDLAITMPEVSDDGLTWTFRLRPGLRYAPPLDDREIVARDFITALERTIRVGESPYHDVIEGVGPYRDGEAGTISGAQAPDDETLVLRLTEPAGDFGNRVAMAYLSPIAAEAIAEHDDDYAGFLAASGPYMLEGRETIDHADPIAPPSWVGHALGEITLVRNPSWSPAHDPLRSAHVDRIELIPLPDRGDAALATARGEIDVMLDPMLATARDEATADATMRSGLIDAPLSNLFFIPLNLAQPPFDDVAVRRAVNLVIDRASLLTTFDATRGSAFQPAEHAFPDVAVGGLLRDYSPFATADSAGDLRRAREQMAESRYDTDGDGRCEGDACRVTANPYSVTGDGALEIIRANLSEIGLEVTWVDEPFIADPASHVAFTAIVGWAADYPSANDFAGLLTDPGPGALDWSLIGATPEQLDSWGYDVASVPSLDGKIASCRSRGGSAAFECWAELDQLLTERMVAWVPIARSVGTWLPSDRVERFMIAGAEAISGAGSDLTSPGVCAMIRRGQGDSRRLATVLFTDMVGSTERAIQLGDRSWRVVLRRHHRAVRAQLRRFGGHEIDSAGDGFFATFPQPAQAVRCAIAIRTAVRPLGVTVRSGVHTGEVEPIGAKVGGIAVHLAARVLAAADPDEILVTSTVRDLVAGSELTFADAGSRTFKGFAEEWHVFRVTGPEPSTVDTPAAERPPGERLSLRPAIAIGGVIGGALVIGVIALLGLTGERPEASAGPNTVVRIDGANSLADAVAIARGPMAIVAADGALWVASEAGTVSRVDLDDLSMQVVGESGSRRPSRSPATRSWWGRDMHRGSPVSTLRPWSCETVRNSTSGGWLRARKPSG